MSIDTTHADTDGSSAAAERAMPAEPATVAKKGKLKQDKPKSGKKVQGFVPSHFSVSRSLNPGLFHMFGASSAGPGTALLPVKVEVSAVRGTKSHFMENPAKLDDESEHNPRDANPQRIERAYLPASCDTLVVKGSVRVIGGARNLESCGSAEYRAAHTAFLDAFERIDGFRAIAERYVMNAINGRWLWRNRYSPSVSVKLACEEVSETFDANACDGDFALSIERLPADKQPAARMIADKVAAALAFRKPSQATFLEMEARVLLGHGSEVYPSQEMTEKKDKNDKTAVGKILAKAMLADNTAQAVMHDQKVGNGLRTIDTWYSGNARAIAVEPYGSTPLFNRAERIDTAGAKTFYALQNELVTLTEDIDTRRDDALYFGAMLVRGGLLGRGATATAPAKTTEPALGQE